jgi:serine/threonine-protein kinase HipA
VTTRYVFIHLPGTAEAIPAGKLDMSVDARGDFASATFAYGKRYLQRPNAMEVDPVSLPIDGAGSRERTPLNGLPMFGAIRDAMPDAWGRRVIENRLRRAGPLPEWLYLDHAGSDRAGALDVRPSLDSAPSASSLPDIVDLNYLLQAAERIEAGEPVPAQLAHYFQGGPTMGGMRPKAVILADGRQFLAKFPSRTDRFNMPAVERATLELAREAGLDVPETRLVPMPDGRAVMLIERFDRMMNSSGTVSRRHMVSALTMLGVSEMNSPYSSYADIAHVISRRAPKERIEADRIELFRRMVFNVLVSNSDDHLRNHAFLRHESGWVLSPLYDVVPTPSASLERHLHLIVGDMGRAARVDNALSSAGQFGLRRAQAIEIIDQVYRVVRAWRQVFDLHGVTHKDCDLVASAFMHEKHIGMREVLSGKRG